MTLLVFGSTGQVGQALAKMEGVTALSRAEADLSQPSSCAQAIRDYAPKAVINAAAYTNVDQAEAEPELARLINAEAPGAMARTCAALDIPFVHISTDYVFDGQGEGAFQPDAETGPLNAYGETKLAGENAVRAAGGCSAILRTSWVFSATGRNFLTTMLRLGAERDRLNVVADQIGGPTPANAIAEACVKIAAGLKQRPDLSGTYHISGAPDVSWAGFARAIFKVNGLGVAVSDIETSQYPTPARRPLNSRLDCSSLHANFGIERPDWYGELQRIARKDAA